MPSSDRQLFRRGPAPMRSALGFSLLAFVLLGINYFTDWLDPVRSRALDLVSPLYRVTDIPQQLRDWSDTSFAGREVLLGQIQELTDQNLILQARVATMASLSAENNRLRQLLNVAELVEERVLITEVVGLPPGLEVHRLIIDKSGRDDVYIGQPVIDAEGLVGQVAAVGESYSEVLLITDRSHAVPVQSLRSSVRAIAEGTGEFAHLRLRNLPVTTDIKTGDLLVTSGLGDRFSKGYPVGQVTSVSVTESSSFLEVLVEPSSSLQTTRHMLLLFSERQTRVLLSE